MGKGRLYPRHAHGVARSCCVCESTRGGRGRRCGDGPLRHVLMEKRRPAFTGGLPSPSGAWGSGL
jgi:hypothetical protein